MLEAMIKAKKGTSCRKSSRLVTDVATEKLTKFPNIITCPSELVALSAALGYAQVTGIPVRDFQGCYSLS